MAWGFLSRQRDAAPSECVSTTHRFKRPIALTVRLSLPLRTPLESTTPAYPLQSTSPEYHSRVPTPVYPLDRTHSMGDPKSATLTVLMREPKIARTETIGREPGKLPRLPFYSYVSTSYVVELTSHVVGSKGFPAISGCTIPRTKRRVRKVPCTKCRIRRVRPISARKMSRHAAAKDVWVIRIPGCACCPPVSWDSSIRRAARRGDAWGANAPTAHCAQVASPFRTTHRRTRCHMPFGLPVNICHQVLRALRSRRACEAALASAAAESDNWPGGTPWRGTLWRRMP